jgi:6-phosphogluconolactonase/glucosamine-6-phosphate isomerase/deaminase
MNIIRDTQHSSVGAFIAERILAELALGKKVLWLIPGGSSIPAAAAAAEIIAGSAHEGLAVTLTDERYGPVGHMDSNWGQLMATGFELPQAELVPILIGETRQITTSLWAGQLERLVAQANFILGFFGIGADGHIAGMLPHTPPLTSIELAASYTSGQFERISITPRVMGDLDCAVAFTQGESKWPTLSRLSEDLSIEEHPVQQLKRVAECTLFTDYVG